MPRPDNESLREALEWWTVDPKEVGQDPYRELLVEAARLCADPDTLVISKVNGDWPEWARKIVQNNTPRIVLDALLAQQTGDTE